MHPHQSPIRRHLDGQGAKVCTKGRLPTSKRENRLRPRSLIGFSCTLPTFPEMFSSRDWGQSSKIAPKHFQPIALQATAKSIVQATADYIAILIIARWGASLFALHHALDCTVLTGVHCAMLTGVQKIGLPGQHRFLEFWASQGPAQKFDIAFFACGIFFCKIYVIEFIVVRKWKGCLLV